MCYASGKRKSDSKGNTVGTDAEDKEMDPEAQATEASSSPEGRSSHNDSQALKPNVICPARFWTCLRLVILIPSIFSLSEWDYLFYVYIVIVF